MQLYQLANDHATYGDHALWWLVVSNDLENELAGPFETEWDALAWIYSQPIPDLVTKAQDERCAAIKPMSQLQARRELQCMDNADEAAHKA